MPKKPPLINILTYRLPRSLSTQIYNEYQDRLREAVFIIENSRRYESLQKNMSAVENLLALSIFHKRVICSLDGATKFHTTISKKSSSDTITIGSYNFTKVEKNKITGLLIGYRNLLAKYSLTPNLMDYTFTKDFLFKLVTYKSLLDANKESN